VPGSRRLGAETPGFSAGTPEEGSGDLRSRCEAEPTASRCPTLPGLTPSSLLEPHAKALSGRRGITLPYAGTWSLPSFISGISNLFYLYTY